MPDILNRFNEQGGIKGRGHSHNFKDMTGQKFGRLTVVKFIGCAVEGKNAMWECKCDCGNNTTISRVGIRVFEARGGTPTSTWHCVPSCGCSLQEGILNPRPHYKPKNPRPKGTTGKNTLLKRYRGAARKRGFEWSLTTEEFIFLTSATCHYCGAEPSKTIKTEGRDRDQDYRYNGIDRLDNLLGYTKSNSLPCCSICNWAKHTMSYDRFTQWIDRVARHERAPKPTTTPDWI